MTIPVLMPALSPTMTEGKLAKWLKAEGDAVQSGDVLAEIETDKATMEVEAVDEGVVGKILVPAGSEGVSVNAVIAVLLEEGEDASAIDVTAAPAAPAAPTPTAPTPAAPAPAAVASAPAPVPSTPPPSVPAAGQTRVVASPLARRLAAQRGLDLARITGSGPHGRIIKRDVEAAPASAAAPARAGATALADLSSDTPYTEVPNNTARKVIARRLTEAKHDIPHFYLSIECEIDALLEARKQLNARAPEGEGAYKLSVNDLIIKAVALALREVPAANATWTDSAIRLYDRIDVSVAVATPNGLITPVLRAADMKGLAALSNEMKTLAGKARAGRLVPEEYQGGGFTISNLGMYGISQFSAILNPPQSAILAVGAGEQKPVVRDGQVVIRTLMTCTLSVDHRSVDGAVGAEFLAAFKKIVECPLAMIL